jgi:hypothetical protein
MKSMTTEKSFIVHALEVCSVKPYSALIKRAMLEARVFGSAIHSYI